MRKQISEEKWKELFKLVPRLVTDGVVIQNNKLLLVQRVHEPFKGSWCLPGGFVDKGERVKKACEREFYEETGIKSKAVRLIGIYDDPKRDPRGHVISIAFLLRYKSGKIRVSNESSDVRFFDIEHLPKLPTDHRNIINDALKILGKRNK